MICDSEHVFICLFAICISLLIYVNVFCFLIIKFLRFVCIFWITVLYQICFLQGFPPICGLSSNTLDPVFYRVDIFNFNEVQITNLFLSQIVFLVLYLKRHHLTQGHLGFLLCYLLGVFSVVFCQPFFSSFLFLNWFQLCCLSFNH